jgi:serine/threonine protein kinase
MGKQKTVGTANYMAPEQAANPEQVDERADIYSLAVTFYKMFTKQLPTGELKAPSFLNPKIPRTIDSLVQKGMSQNPADRFASVQQFCDALVETFRPVNKPGVGDSSQSSGPMMFNPDLLSGTGQAGIPSGTSDGDSSASSLFNPFIFPSADSGYGSSAVGPTSKELRAQQRAAAEAVAEKERRRRRTMFIWVGGLAGFSLLVAVAALVVWAIQSGYL